MPAGATSVAGVLVYPASVAENVPVGATVGTLSAPPGGAYTYTLVAGPGDTDNGAFTIDGNQLMLTVSPNYEVKNSYALRVQASDGTNTYASPLTVTITNVAEAPVAVDGDVAATSWDATAVPLELPDGADLSGTRGT
jgi:hypothetical protein